LEQLKRLKEQESQITAPEGVITAGRDEMSGFEGVNMTEDRRQPSDKLEEPRVNTDLVQNGICQECKCSQGQHHPQCSYNIANLI
jgi:hypothetical protein